MGINTSIAKLLGRARLHGASFTRTGTIGRQSLAVPKKDLKAITRRLGIHDVDWSMFATNGFADDSFRILLGAESVRSIDYSDYEKVDIVHDLNAPVPETLHGTFDALVDGGSLEHIFDVKQVLTNYMNMVSVGGSLFVVTTANNMCGRGFYQFSPEFFYRVFGRANGFIVNEAILIESPLLSVETSRHQRCFRVVDPAKIGRRIELVNRKPVLIFLHHPDRRRGAVSRDSTAKRLLQTMAVAKRCRGGQSGRRAVPVSDGSGGVPRPLTGSEGELAAERSLLRAAQTGDLSRRRARRATWLSRSRSRGRS